MTQSNDKTGQSRLRIGKTPMLALVATVALSAFYLSPAVVADKAIAIAAPSAEVFAGLPVARSSRDSIVFAGGCFWGIQAVFQHTKGVLNAVSGYAGGKANDAEYETVSSGNTGHAESVQVTFDPKQVSYGQLLQIYFSVAHDPTQLNRQYPDAGPQYRSAIFYHDPAQKLVAERYMSQLDSSKAYSHPIVTQLNALDQFYPAERYHQNYATLHPEYGYIAHFDLPKIENLKSMYPTLYRERPVLVVQ